MGSVFHKKTTPSSTIPITCFCPFCRSTFPPKTTFIQFNSHISCCCLHFQTSSVLSFEEKLSSFRSSLSALKEDWRLGFCELTLDRTFLLAESISQVKRIDIYKELKINFKGEVSYDAGGIIREWLSEIVKLVLKSVIFKRADSKDFSLIFDENVRIEEERELLHFLGIVIGKALLENMSLNLCFNKMIYKLLLDEAIAFEDLVFIDNQLYHSLKMLKNKPRKEVKDLAIPYAIDRTDKRGKVVTVNLITNGSDIVVESIDDYIEKRISYLISLYTPFALQIKASLFKIIPSGFFAGLNSDELMLICEGQPFIDVEDWKAHSTYQGVFSPSHEVIVWFWEIVGTLEQDKLAKLLSFATGSAKVPIEGFRNLESNRGEISKFCLVSVERKTKHNFINAHTCFNRMDLPLFQSKKEIEIALKFVVENEILGFGID